MIEPGVRALVQATTSGRVGVIGTVGTISSGAYQRAVGATGADVELARRGLPGLRRVRRAGRDERRPGHDPRRAPAGAGHGDADVDALLLGCTHYPYLARVIGDVMGRDVVLVSSADETAFEVRRLLDETGLRRAPPARPAERAGLRA